MKNEVPVFNDMIEVNFLGESEKIVGLFYNDESTLRLKLLSGRTIHVSLANAFPSVLQEELFFNAQDVEFEGVDLKTVRPKLWVNGEYKDVRIVQWKEETGRLNLASIKAEVGYMAVLHEYGINELEGVVYDLHAYLHWF